VIDPGEVRLAGGFITEVVRVGDTVRRATTARTAWVHALLAHLHDAGFGAAPRPLGIDEHGREILTFLDGATHHGAERDDAVLVEVMRAVRRLHDLTVDLAGGEGECIVHGDLSPRNTVCAAGRFVGLIDWDQARPGSRLFDVSRACWQFVDPGPRSDPAVVARRWRLMADAYGLDGTATLVAEVLDRLEENADGIEVEAAAGSAPHRRLVELDAPATIRMVREWVVEHRDALERGVARSGN
jgi:aminoglycoside phosphotransferase (APT) family kinase protein